jgi:Fic family protein
MRVIKRRKDGKVITKELFLGKKVPDNLEEIKAKLAFEVNKPVEIAGRAHFMFEKIHPFGDGNGRIGRLLLNCILWKNGYPMLIFEYRKRKAYYKALQRNEEGFTNYFIRRYVSVHKKLLQ